MADDIVLDLCPNCGAFITDGSDTCSSCGSELGSGGEKEGSTFQCGVCGKFMGEGVEKCPHCDSPVEGAGAKQEIDLDPDEYDGFLDFIIDDEHVVEDGKIDLPIKDTSLDELEGEEDEKRAAPMEDFFDEIEIEKDYDEWPEEKPDVRDEVKKTVLVESLVDRVDGEVRFDDIKEDDMVRLCSNCGGLVSASARECTVCGEELTNEKLLIPRNVKKDILEKMPIKEAEDAMKKVLGILGDWEPEYDLEDPTGLADNFVCLKCGAFIPQKVNECPSCGAGVDGMHIAPDEDSGPEELMVNVCNRCGAFLNSDAEACNVCGQEISGADEEPAPEIEPAYDEDKAESIFKNLLGVSDVPEPEEKAASGGEISLCPDCGAFVSPEAVTCSVCDASLVESEKENIDLEREINELAESACPNCASPLPAGISDCEVCGFSFFDDDDAVSELDVLESDEGLDLAVDILDNLDLEMPESGGPDAAGEPPPEPDGESVDIEDLLVLDDLDEGPEEEPKDVSDEEFESFLEEIDETIQQESGMKEMTGPVERVEIDIGVRLLLLRKAFDGGAISRKLYRRNLETFMTDVSEVDRLVAELPPDEAEPEIDEDVAEPETPSKGLSAEERLVMLKKAYSEGTISKDIYRDNLRVLMDELREDGGIMDAEEVAVEEPAGDSEYVEIETGPELPEGEPPDETAYEEDFDELLADEEMEYEHEPPAAVPQPDDDIFADDAVLDKIEERERHRDFNLATWDYGVYASLATSLIYVTFNWVIPGDYSISLAIIFGVILLAGVYLLFNCRGAFYRKDFLRGIPFMAGGLLLSLILIHWYAGFFNDEIGAFAQPRFDRVLLSTGIIFVGIGIIWVRSRVRYIFMWILGTALLFLFALGELVYFERWAYSPIQPPGELMFAVGLVMVVFSAFLLAYEKMLESSIETDIVRGDISYLRRDYKSALASYDSAVAKTTEAMVTDVEGRVPVNYDVPWYSKGAALILMGRLEEGIKCMDMALAINPKNEMAWTSKGNALSRMGDQEGALFCYNKAIESNPRYVIAYNNMGNALARNKDYVGALKYYNKAIRMSPDYHDAWINKGYVLAKMGKSDMAKKCIDVVTGKTEGRPGAKPGFS